MSEAIEMRDRMEWNRVSALMALLCNINRDPKHSSVAFPSEFNPYTAKESKRKNVVEVKDAESRDLFKAVFTGQKPISAVEVYSNGK
jgi:hypothetical protein